MATIRKRGEVWQVQVWRQGVRKAATFRTKREAIIMKPSVFDADDAPKITADFFKHACYRVAGREVTRDEWAASVRQQMSEHRESVMLASAVVEAFKARAGDNGDYQALMEEALLKSL
ncbi:MAG: hypothetical protein LBB76_02745 [Azoarcus sp.]|nr:hypothetical protein [Azoarcus sp.]